MPRNQIIEEKLSVLPHSPGVYLMKNAAGSIIYVGKSKNLKNRVSSYFQSSDTLTFKTQKLVSHIADFEIIVTSTEAEAFILENELIKLHTPKYNIKLKDSKTYPYIKVTADAYPHILLCHTRRNDKAKYFGPYPSAPAARDIIQTIQTTFKLPTCGKSFHFGKAVCRPCLNYHIDKCAAPCMGTVSEEEFAETFKEVEMILKGDYEKAENSLKEKMNAAAKALRFETAAKYRDSIRHLASLSDRQKIKTTPDVQKDIFGFFESETYSAIAVLLVRNGVIIDKDILFLAPDEISDPEELADLVARYYPSGEIIPGEITLSFDLTDETESALSEMLSEKAGRTVYVRTPKRGKNKELCAMAVENAKEAIRTRKAREENDSDLLIRLAELLRLEVVPERIESYDISNSADTDIYCGMIVLENTHFKKSDYRSFAIKTTEGADDYGAMREALSRRFSHILDDTDTSSLHTPPDLILLDGGIGQVSAVKAVAEELGISVPVFGMVKDAFHKTRTLTDGEAEISIAKDSQIFSFIYKIQEEVHRFSFFKMDASRRKKMKTLALTAVPGIGEAKAKALYSHFSGIQALREASVEQLSAVKGITPALAQAIHQFLNSEE